MAIKAATVRDVARRAGVSHTTVSRVINGEAIVTPETRQMVERAIAELKFVPNLAARALSGAEQLRVGLLHRFPNPGSLGEFLVHLLHEATKTHASLVVHRVADADQRRAAIADLVERGVRAVVLAPPLADDCELVDQLVALNIVMVATGLNRRSCRQIASVGIDDRTAARTMTQHLLSLGHRRLGFIKGDPQYASAGLRLSGFQDALALAGLPADPAHIAEGNYTYQSGLIAAEQLIGVADRPTAIFASNDDMAAAVVSVAHRHRIDVPQQLSVCGFDDSALATTIWPALTTIRRPTLELTREAFRMISAQLARAGTADDSEHVLLHHLLVRRQSDGPPPGV
ncbi:LacI family DNA-binding transcriptional regulator [Sphingomonas sp. 37zxx]|uniref:LacI family DNA-binding transcriptional regulator n=1 Tax=Sphingomonas sp. 37zxx TaxID=1550073 RepID=UPI00053BFF41|nr:LacI family DNA-binding transcriptional regulator [Sphingomonas sp. 37zxx]